MEGTLCSILYCVPAHVGGVLSETLNPYQGHHESGAATTQAPEAVAAPEKKASRLR